MTAVPIFAHGGEPLAPHDLWQRWSWEPWVLGGIGISVLIYWRGVRALWQRAGRGRVVSGAKICSFGSGLLVIALALISPLAAVSEALFSAHMVQHILLMNVAAPLLVWGVEPLLLLWALPLQGRRGLFQWWQRRGIFGSIFEGVFGGLWHWFNRPLTVWSLYAASLWIWHAPRFYQAAMDNETLHLLEHLTFMGSAILFWWVLAQPRGRSLQVGTALLLLFTTALQSGLLAAIITFAPLPLYPIYALQARAWGLTLLADQQLAGVIMWVPVGFVYLGALLWRLWQQLIEGQEESMSDELSIPEQSTSFVQQSN